MRHRTPLLLAALIVTLPAGMLAAPTRPLPVAGANTQKYLTQEVAPDGKATLRIGAPTASEAQLLIGEASAEETSYPMQKDKDGVWSATVGPLPPEIYHYTFRIGGAKVNGAYFEVPGTPARFWEMQNVPHGSVTEHVYQSAAQNRPRLLHVYVPPQYASEPSRRFPVLYLWKPGGWQTEWSAAGRVQTIFDNLIAAGKAVPMIVVMPDIDVPATVSMGSPAARDLLDREMVLDIVPFVDQRYRTRADRADRAITGISQSGATAFTVGMRHLDMFGSVGEFGTGFFGGLLNPPGYTSYVAYNPDNVTPNMNQKLRAPATRLRLLYMSAGADDPRMPFQRKVAEDFRKDGIPVVFETFPGGHEYTVWRHSMADMAARLFK